MTRYSLCSYITMIHLRLACFACTIMLTAATSLAELKAVRHNPIEHLMPQRRVGAWYSVSPGTTDAVANFGAWSGIVNTSWAPCNATWQGCAQPLWSDHLDKLAGANIRQVIFHLPFGKPTGRDMAFSAHQQATLRLILIRPRELI